jgi:hypothetical protein
MAVGLSHRCRGGWCRLPGVVGALAATGDHRAGGRHAAASARGRVRRSLRGGSPARRSTRLPDRRPITCVSARRVVASRWQSAAVRDGVAVGVGGATGVALGWERSSRVLMTILLLGQFNRDEVPGRERAWSVRRSRWSSWCRSRRRWCHRVHSSRSVCCWWSRPARSIRLRTDACRSVGRTANGNRDQRRQATDATHVRRR